MIQCHSSSRGKRIHREVRKIAATPTQESKIGKGDAGMGELEKVGFANSLIEIVSGSFDGLKQIELD